MQKQEKNIRKQTWLTKKKYKKTNLKHRISTLLETLRRAMTATLDVRCVYVKENA